MDGLLDRAQFPKEARLMGLDVGTKTLGLALSDIRWTIASPLQTLTFKKFSAILPPLRDLIAQHQVAALVVGLPMNMDGTEGPRCQGVRQQAKNLEAALGLSLYFWDERLSTLAVTRTLLEADVSRSKRAEVVDKMAASYILQGFLDRLQQDS